SPNARISASLSISRSGRPSKPRFLTGTMAQQIHIARTVDSGDEAMTTRDARSVRGGQNAKNHIVTYTNGRTPARKLQRLGGSGPKQQVRGRVPLGGGVDLVRRTLQRCGGGEDDSPACLADLRHHCCRALRVDRGWNRRESFARGSVE